MVLRDWFRWFANSVGALVTTAMVSGFALGAWTVVMFGG